MHNLNDMAKKRTASLIGCLVLTAACTPRGSGNPPGEPEALAPLTSQTPSDDPADWKVDTSVEYEPVIGAPRFVVPSARLPAKTRALDMASNNNGAIVFHEGRLYLAFRTAPVHFASIDTKILVVSSGDLGKTWDDEATVAMGTDLREPNFISLGGRLVLYFFQGGTNPLGFEPRNMYRIVRKAPGVWSDPVVSGVPGEIPWEVKVRGGQALMTSYAGEHYQAGPSSIEVFFKRSSDGLSWEPADATRPVSYRGGICEVGWELDEAGAFLGVGRNEDGDDSGFGSLIFTAPATATGHWDHPAHSDPTIYESPRMFRHGKDLYLIARRNLDGPFDKELTGLTPLGQKFANLAAYSLSAKRTALFRVDRASGQVVWLADLPSNGDTAFASIRRMDADRFLVANYTSPLGNPDRFWFTGQIDPAGTAIYLIEIDFRKRG